MHFFTSQGCGYSGRYHIPPSISGYGRNQRNLCAGYYPKPMVTPVRRFQSIESVANNGLRFTRSPGYHSRVPMQNSSAVHFSGSNIRIPQGERSSEIINRQNTSTSSTISTTAKLKCGIITLFLVIVTFFLAVSKYFFDWFPASLGAEALVFCLVLLILLIIGALITICEAVGCSPSNTAEVVQEPTSEALIEQQNDNEDVHHSSQVPSMLSPQDSAELPPPPYHIAVMFSQQNDLESIQIIRDSPPPSYEKAVT